MLKQVIEILDLLDRGTITGEEIVNVFSKYQYVHASTITVSGSEGTTDFVKIIIEGTDGKTAQGISPTIGVIGRLGGIGARPNYIGMVSDGDGAVAALSIALKLSEMGLYKDRLPGDVIITTHICPNAPVELHEPVDFMGSPVDMEQMNQYEVLEEVDAILSIDTTKGNNIITRKGFAFSPTVKEGYILRVSQDLINIMEITSGQSASTFPLSIQDITPYSNNLYHINSILQPSTATKAPVVGIAITTETAVPGCATGASHEIDIAEVGRFAIEVAKQFTAGIIHLYDENEYKKLIKLYGKMNILQTNPKV
ncbi:MAG: DUF1177 domain-containing protein [Erysipelotrichaceae bacterium]